MKTGVILLVATAILTLPLHLTYFSPGQMAGISMGADIHTSADLCDHAMNKGGVVKHCDTHASGGGADDCCGDNCSGSQIFLPVSYLAAPINEVRFTRLQIGIPPKALFERAYRPPIPYLQA